MTAIDFRPCVGRPYTVVPALAKTEGQGLGALPKMPGWTRGQDENPRQGGGGRPSLSGGGEILPEGSFLVRDLEDGEQVEIRVLAGHLWVTVAGDARDYVLAEGNRRCFAGPGRLVAEAVGAPAEIGVAEPVARPVWKPSILHPQP